MARNVGYSDKIIFRRRMLINLSIFFVLFIFLCLRLAYIMLFKSNEYIKLATDQWTSEVKIDAKRGSILDRNGLELAVSANVYRADADMNTLRKYMELNKISIDTIIQRLASAMSEEVAYVRTKLSLKLPNGKDVGSVILKRRIDEETANKVKALNIKGIVISPDTKRFYPNDSMLCHVLGHTNSDGTGLTGVELTYNSILTGTAGYKLTETEKQNNQNVESKISQYIKPVDGNDVVLTIDKMIQLFCEKAANEAMIENNAKGVSIIVMNPQNGEILAMVNKPDYDLNNPWVQGYSYSDLQKIWRNHCVSDTFEPGSIFKVVTATAALEEGVVSDSDKFNCSGSLVVGGRTIHCANRKGHGEQSFLKIIENSCNVGFMKLGERLGAEKLVKYIDLFGFGKKTGIDLNGEATGIVKRKSITNVDLASMSFGQVNTVTPVEYMAGFNAIANGGTWITPHVMKEVVEAGGDINTPIKVYTKYNKTKTLNTETMKVIREDLEKVVYEGGGKNAFIAGYHIAGKTGTAQKVINGRYAPGKYIASFAGMAPAENPRLTIFVSIDEPDPGKYYASLISAPVAKEVFNDIFNYLNMKPDVSYDEVSKSLRQMVIVPDVRGLSVKDAAAKLKEFNLSYEAENAEAVVESTVPMPGFSIAEGSKIMLYSTSEETYNNRKVVVPDLYGYTQESATMILENLGFKPYFKGNGVVINQSLKSGESVTMGMAINLELGSPGD